MLKVLLASCLILVVVSVWTLGREGDLSLGRKPWQNLQATLAEMSEPSFLKLWFGDPALPVRNAAGQVPLDADAADEIVRLLAGVALERRATLISVVHDLDLLPRLADRAIALRRGAIVADVAVTAGTPGQLRHLLK